MDNNNNTEQSPEPFRVRLNCLDYYQTSPTSLDPPLWGPPTATQRTQAPHVPVIRVFGATPTGQKVCAHIHGALPYLYIPYTESREAVPLQQNISALRHSIDHALAISYRRNPYDSGRSSTFVAHISLVKGVPFFGYSVGYAYFLKIHLLNPNHMTRFADLLQSGAVMHRVFQPYEAHLQFLLQWMCDFNLYGCAFVEVEARKVRFRGPVPRYGEEGFWGGHRWHDRSVGAEAAGLFSGVGDGGSGDDFPRLSHCELEVDFRVEDIMNRREVKARELHHSFVERLVEGKDLPIEEKLVHSMAGLWKDETRRRKKRMGISNPGSSPFPPEVLVSMSADPRRDGQGGWIHEEEFRGLVEELAKQEKKARGGGGLTFESFVKNSNFDDDGVRTVHESVVDLFQETLLAKFDVKHSDDDEVDVDDHGEQLAGVSEKPGSQFKPEAEPVVDMSSIAQLDHDEEYDSDEDVAREKALTQRQKLEKAGIDGAIGEAKVDGDVNDIKARAERVDPVSVPDETVDAAEQPSTKRSPPSQSQGPFKRVKINPREEERPPSRHVSFRVKDIRPTKPAKGPPSPTYSKIPAAQIPPQDDLADLPSAQPPPSSQVSQSSSQSRRLSYPVIKNPNDPDGPLRLSQREDMKHLPHRNSQESRRKDHLTSSLETTSKSSGSSSKGTLTSASTEPSISPRLLASYTDVFPVPRDTAVFLCGSRPPTFEEVERTVSPSVIYQDAYYSNERDVPERTREYAGQEFRLESNTLPYLQPFDKSGEVSERKGIILDKAKEELIAQRRRRECSLKHWQIMRPPPTFDEVQKWLDEENEAELDDLDDLEVDGPPTGTQIKRKNRPAPELSQIEGPTQKNRHGFKFSQRKPSTSVQHETGYMSTMALEVHVNSRGELAPDPEKDEVSMIFWRLQDEGLEEEESRTGILVLSDPEDVDLLDRIRRTVDGSVEVEAEDSELDLINRTVDIVRELDPDILTGYEVHNSSWGYLIERARLHYEYNLPDEFSRMKSQSHGRFGKDADRWGFTHTSTVRITGRHTINVWRAMRSELNLLQYTMENVVFHLLHQRIPHYPYSVRTRWYQSRKPRDLKRVLDYFLTRTKLDLDILDANELVPRTSEQARLLGVDFFSVFSRGSQFKVESLMFRIAKPESFVLVSPSRKQVGAQNALECLPLVMEPQSAFYNSPLLVLDFQSLYPSVMIAYNYCYSTCLGRIVNWRGTNKLGFADFQREPGLLELVKDKLNIAPNGMMYVKPEMRKSLLAKMLGEILETRVMVKSGMKVDKNDKTLQQLLNNRQLALKLIANVTYGYTSASFSGRMPCAEIADSIVQTGRETLEKAIALIHSVERWGAEVVYGDTDSLFIYLKGKTKADAFKIGDEIAKTVTDMNPRPVKLKFEKVYHPCVLLAKKRYVGFKYESPSQTVPEFDAKGIETVRRDGTPAEQKIEEKALKLLFRTSDLSEVKKYFQAQCTKIMTGRVSVQDFCFAKEVKLGTYADKGPPPPGALIATRRMLRDPRSEPQYGERVPYVVVAGGPGARLWERCVEPERLVYDEHAELDAEYYISKNLIPPLERIFNLVGANVRSWYDEMPKVQRIRMLAGGAGAASNADQGNAKSRKTMESYMNSSLCLVCRAKLPPLARPQEQPSRLPLCDVCRLEKPARTLLALRRKLQKAEKKAGDMKVVCRSCAELSWAEEVHCDSRDCPVFYSRVKADTQLRVAENGVGTVLNEFEDEVAARSELHW